MDEWTSSIEHPADQAFYRRSSEKVAKMLQQILQRGEMQVHPHRIQQFLHRLGRGRVD